MIEDDTSPVIIRANGYRIREMLGNVIRNAVQHGDKAVPIRIGLERHHGWAILSVIDEGDALPADKADYFRLAGITSALGAQD